MTSFASIPLVSMTKLLPLLFACLLAVGCGGGTTFYMLSADGPLPSGGGRSIGVGPVVLAEYINRPNLVLQESEHSLAVASDHRWAGELANGVSRVMAANLGRRLGTGNVQVYPWQRDSEITQQVVIDIRQLHGGADGNAILEASYRIYDLPARTLRVSKTFNAKEPLEKDGYEPLVAAESRLLSRMADAIAASMR
jgi:uncharacterized lipoprotein YmbA